jgi:hypothetical protein
MSALLDIKAPPSSTIENKTNDIDDEEDDDDEEEEEETDENDKEEEKNGAKETSSDKTLKELICHVCKNVICAPITLQCQHSFCQRCICDDVLEKKPLEMVSCPSCRKQSPLPDIFAVNDMLQNLVKLLVGEENYQNRAGPWETRKMLLLTAQALKSQGTFRYGDPQTIFLVGAGPTIKKSSKFFWWLLLSIVFAFMIFFILKILQKNWEN